MSRSHRTTAGVAALIVGLALTTVVPGAVGRSADAADLKRAGVVVDPGDGSGPHTACVWFEEESITGLELLARSTFDAGIRAFGGLGGAVCSIGGTGCSTDSACLSCGGTQYWAYALANPGDPSFSQAPVGPGSRTVTDGAVDGWRWGSGDPPAFRSIDRICPAAPPTTPTSPAAPPAPPAAAPPAAAPPSPTPGLSPDAPGVPPPSQPLTEAPTTPGSTPAGATSTSAPSTTVVPTSAPSSTSTTSSTTTVAPAPEGPGATVAAAAIVGGEEEPAGDGGGTGALGVVAMILAAGLGAGAFWRMRRAG